MQKIPDTGRDDKCPCCGEWTPRAYREYGGCYSDGSPMDYCTCDGEAEDERGWPSHVYAPSVEAAETARLVA